MGGGGDFLWGHLNSTVYESNPHTIQELKDNSSHAVAAIKITVTSGIPQHGDSTTVDLTVQTLYAVYTLTAERIAQGHVQN